MKKPRYVNGVTDRFGKSRYYLRRPGFKSVSLPGLPWSPTFMAAYEAAMSGEIAPRIEIGASRTKPGTLNEAIVRYYDSQAFHALAPLTQKNRRAILERFASSMVKAMQSRAASVSCTTLLWTSCSTSWRSVSPTRSGICSKRCAA
jgi:hypothetical protein